MCDLWKNTLIGARAARRDRRADPRRPSPVFPPARHVKLYNAGSFFDPRAIPPGDFEEIAALVSPFERVDRRVAPGPRRRALPALARSRSTGRLEVAHRARDDPPGRPAAAEQADVARATSQRPGRSCATPASPCASSSSSAFRSLARGRGPRLGAAARSPSPSTCGASTVAAHSDPVRQRRARRARRRQASSPSPGSRRSRTPLDFGLGLGRGRVFADLWDLERFRRCDACFAARAGAAARESNLPPGASRARRLRDCGGPA